MLGEDMEPYYQVATDNSKENPSAVEQGIHPWFVHHKKFDNIDDALCYARSFKESLIIKSQVFKQLSTYLCDRCSGEGIVRSTYDIGDFDTCDNCNGGGRVFFGERKNQDW